MDFNQLLSGFGWLAAGVLWLASCSYAFEGEALGAWLCNSAGMAAVWFAMHEAHLARHAWREFKVDCARDVIGSLLPTVETE